MYCKYCGQQIPDNSKFCPKCGKDLRPAQEQNNTEEKKIVLTMPETVKATLDTTPVSQTVTPVTQPKKKGLPVLLVIIPLLLLLAGGAAAYFFLFNKPLDPADFVKVSYYYYSSGSIGPSVEIDYDVLSEKIGERRMKEGAKKLLGPEYVKAMESQTGRPFDYLFDEYFDYMLESDFFYGYLYGPSADLKYGDEVTVKFMPGIIDGTIYAELTLDDINKALGVRMPETYTVVFKGMEGDDQSSIQAPETSSDTHAADTASGSASNDLASASPEAIGNMYFYAALISRYSSNIEQETSYDLSKAYFTKNKNSGGNGLAFLLRNAKGEDKIIAFEDLTLSADHNEFDYYGGNTTYTNSNKSSFYDTHELQEISISPYKDMKPAVGLYGTVTDSQVRIRSGPSTDSDKVTVDGKKVFDKGERVQIEDEARDSNGDLWYQVSFKRNGVSYIYWIFAAYVRLDV